MNSIKCKNCGLSNFPSDPECRRCGLSFIEPKKRKERRPSRFSVFSLVPVLCVLGVAYYFYSGVQGTMEEVNANDTKRVASQPAERPATPGLSRTKYDQQRSGHYGDKVKDSPNLKAHEQRTKDTEKAIQQISNSR
jgi:ribosomal protein L40E